MSNFSGLSAILSVSLVALVTIQMLKEKFEMVENFGEADDYGNSLHQGDAFYTQTTHNNSSDVLDQPMGMHPIQDLSKLQHNYEPFKAVGDFFHSPYISKDADMHSGVPDSYRVYMNNINMATPTPNELESIGSQTQFLPGVESFITDGPGGPNFNSGRAKNLSLCSQNMNITGSAPTNIATSLLPNMSSQTVEGFSDCNLNENMLANQVFLSAQGQAGLMTSSGTNKNSNLDLRSAPPNPMLAVGPWNNSSIYPDLLRRPLEGCGPSFGLYGNGAMGSGVPTTIQ